MSFDLLLLEDACIDCVIAELEKRGDGEEAIIVSALRKGRQDPRRDYARELARVTVAWPLVVRAAEHTCRRQFRRCHD